MGIEFAWYGLATRVDPWRVLATNESLNFGLRPAHYVFIAGIVVVALVVGRRAAGKFRRPSRGVAAQTT
jgi:hypothetical protein